MSFYLPLDHHYAAGVWAVLDRFGYKTAFEELNGSGIHRLENVLTLTPDVNIFFDTFWLWLEPVEVSNSAPRVNWGFELASSGYTQHLQTSYGSFSFYGSALEVYRNIHNSGSRETSCSIASVSRASCCML